MLETGSSLFDNLMDKYRIKQIHPLVSSESLDLNLILITENGLRIYITIDDGVPYQDSNLNNFEELERLNL
jgi:hypothetical protein